MILAADVFGYSALLQHAEEATYAEFERLKRELICRGDVMGIATIFLVELTQDPAGVTPGGFLFGRLSVQQP